MENNSTLNTLLDLQFEQVTDNKEMNLKSHLYTPNIKIFDHPFLESLLAKASTESCEQPHFTSLIKMIYTHMYGLIFSELEKESTSVLTRMNASLSYNKIKENKAIVVDMARAGMVPAQILYEMLHTIYPYQNLRQDHIYISRTTNESEEVTGANIANAKIGGGIEDTYVFIPDPMGATGSSICNVISDYKNSVQGNAKKYICIHLIITPEYIKKINAIHPDAQVYALRLDRGLSSPKALAALPGEFSDEEKGLNEKHYIVPGAGGVGELLNNSFV